MGPTNIGIQYQIIIDINIRLIMHAYLKFESYKLC